MAVKTLHLIVQPAPILPEQCLNATALPASTTTPYLQLVKPVNTHVKLVLMPLHVSPVQIL